MPSGGQNKIPREELLWALAQLSDDLGETPRLKDWREQGEYSAKALYNEFENWSAALDELDMEAHHVVNQERVELPCSGPQCDESVFKTQHEADQQPRHYCGNDCQYEKMSEMYEGDGNPVNTLETVTCFACGCDISRAEWERERYKRNYCSACWGNSKQPIECERCGDIEEVWPSLIILGQRFCSTECMGAWRSEAITGEDHPRSKPGRRPDYYGPNWLRQRRAAVIRDQARCQDCGMSTKESLQRHGEVLSVHHRTPFRTFVNGETVDYENANKLSNLVTLCRPCHSSRDE